MAARASLLLLAFPSMAHAFCGVYVAGEGNEVENHASQVVLSHHGGQTTITIAADAGGDTADFGFLVPLPGTVEQDDIRIADPAAFGFLDAFSTPRQVQYTCGDVRGEYHGEPGCGSAEFAMMADTDDVYPAPADVDVEALFTVGEYEIAILHTSEAGALQGWLDAHRFLAPDDPNGVLQKYVDAGSRFMAARVLVDEGSGAPEYLNPLQWTFDQDDTLHLPIEIGTISARGPQEVVIYVLSDLALGAAHIENYPEVKPEDECMRPDGSDLTSYYAGELDRVLDGEAGWVLEYGVQVDPWGSYHCDPCTTPPIEQATLAGVGWTGDETAYLSRLHVLYAPDQVDGDLDIAFTGETALSQIRYIEYDHALEDLYPVCGEGMRDDPGTCLDDVQADADAACAVPTGSSGFPAGAVLVAILGAARRRRS